MWSPEEDIGSLVTGSIHDSEPPVGAGTQVQVLWKSSQRSQPPTYLPILRLTFILNFIIDLCKK